MKGLVTIHDASAGTRFTAYVDAAETTSLSEILPSLANIAGTNVGSGSLGVAVDGKTVSAKATLAQTGLHEGSWISLLGRGQTPIYPYANTDHNDGFVQLRFISGVNAGAIYDVSAGVMSVGKLLSHAVEPMGADFMLDVTAEGAVRLIPHVHEGELGKRRGLFRRRTRVLTSGVFIDGKEVVEARDLPDGVEVALPECIISVTQGRADSVPVDTSGQDGHWLFARPPKIRDVVKQRRFTLPAEPQKPEKAPIPLLTSMMPLVMAGAMYLLMHSLTYLLFGLMSPVMMIGSYFSGNHASKKRYKQQMKKFRENTVRIRCEASKAVDAEVAQSRKEYPDPTQVLDICARHSAQLWNRRSTDDSWLRVRVGTGTVDSHITLEDPSKMEFERITKWRLDRFPVTVSLPDAGCVGCTGDPEKLYPVVSWMVMQMAALHSTRDLSLYLLSPRSKEADAPQGIDWTFAQWLPQFVPQFGQNAVRTVAVSAEDLALRISELVAMLDERKSEQERQSTKHWLSPAVVTVMEHAHVLRSMPGVIRLLQEGPALGIYTLCIDVDERMLPEECQTVITATHESLRVESNIADDVFDIMPDLVSRDWLDALAGALAPIEDGSPSDDQSAIPDRSRLLDLLDLTPTAEQIEARWALYPRSTACVIGESVDGPFGLDISRDGPHGLIGGTTGSGKSELLQSLVASFAVTNTPQALNFVLVDYKGGAAFKDCVQLPHTVGMVTDLDNHLVSRALVSLGAELNYREHLLAKAGAKDLEDYIDMRESKPGIPEIPRLLIVIDEFASLSRELPDFVTGLVNIAQRGRSLGIHLLLATQRPGGVVSPEIRANTNLRIALRMTDAAESQDVIDAKDAALISKSTPGRAVVRLGSNSLVPFQSARVGGRYVNPSKSKGEEVAQAPFVRSVAFAKLGSPVPQRPQTKKSKGDVNVTDLKMLVDAINEVARREHIPEQRQPWLPALPENIDLKHVKQLDRAGTVANPSHAVIPFALGDYPQSQQQLAVTIDTARFGNMFIVGTSRAGKSTTLKTIAYEGAMVYSPRDLHIYCIDAGSGAIAPLGALPNVGVVALRSETQKIERLIGKLEAEAKGRAGLLSRDGYSSIDEYNGSATAAREGRLPHIVVMLDSWDGFTSVFQSYDGGSLIDRLQILMREGPSCGIHFIITGDHSLLGGRMSVLADSKVLLRLVDSSDYMEVGMPSREVPEKIADGRGYRSEDGAEIQIAQIREGVSGQEESELIRAAGAKLMRERDNDLPRCVMPFSIEQLPDEVTLTSIAEDIRANGNSPGDDMIVLGVGGEDNEPITFDTTSMLMLPVFGTSRSGKTTSLITIANSAIAVGYHVIIAAPKNNALRGFAGRPGVARMFTSPEEMTQEALSAFLDDPKALYVFDDCQLLKDIPASSWLLSLLGADNTDQATFVVAGDAGEFPSGFGSWAARAKSIRQGILLNPDELIYQDLINIRMRRAQITADMPAGRGYLHIGQLNVTIQMAVSEPGEGVTSPGVGEAPPKPSPRVREGGHSGPDSRLPQPNGTPLEAPTVPPAMPPRPVADIPIPPIPRQQR